MPRIAPALLDASFYLYPSPEAAKSGGQAGGTGVFVSVPVINSPGLAYLYAVSNAHVVHQSGCSVIRVNTLVGGTDVIEKDPAEWHARPGDDLAVTLVQVRPDFHKIRCIDENWFVTKRDLADGRIGIGDDVFMVGRFMNHDGLLSNVPSVRFGHLSIGLLGIQHPAGHQQTSFGVEMLSRPGYSGSPVYLYRVPYDLETGNLAVGGRTTWLLGINWGFISEKAEVREEAVTMTGMVEDDRPNTVKYIRVSTGMNGVVPAWHLAKLLNSGPVKRGVRQLRSSRRHLPSELEALALDHRPCPCYTEHQSGGKNLSFFNVLRRHSQFPLGSATESNRRKIRRNCR